MNGNVTMAGSVSTDEKFPLFCWIGRERNKQVRPVTWLDWVTDFRQAKIIKYFNFEMDEFPDEDELQDLIQGNQNPPQQNVGLSQPISGDADGELVVDLDDEDDDDLDALEHLHEVEDKENRFKKSLFQQQNAPGEVISYTGDRLVHVHILFYFLF